MNGHWIRAVINGGDIVCLRGTMSMTDETQKREFDARETRTRERWAQPQLPFSCIPCPPKNQLNANHPDLPIQKDNTPWLSTLHPWNAIDALIPPSIPSPCPPAHPPTQRCVWRRILFPAPNIPTDWNDWEDGTPKCGQ